MNPPPLEGAAEALREPARLPVFAAKDGRPRRTLALVGRVLAGLTALWLLALLAGALGLGRLPGVALPQAGSDAGGMRAPAAPHPARAAGRFGRSATPARTHATAHRVARVPGTHGTGSHTTRSTGSGTPDAAAGRRHGAASSGSGTRAPAAQPHNSTAPATNAAAPSAPPAQAGSAHGKAHSGSAHSRSPGTGAPAGRTDPPGAGKANPRPSATEHSPRWSSSSGG
jgi:hypothetical protein